MRYSTVVTAIGPLLGEFLAERIIVLFNEDAPEELWEFAVIHRPDDTFEEVRPGDLVRFGPNEPIRVTAVGEVANKNIAALGHAVFKCNGNTEAELPGDVCLEQVPLPEVEVGQTINIEAGDGSG
ncbi:MAG: PTS glucitol/sorbitol transporter subunit IIA [Actinobacteria bacterium]|nr:PTS glucitol/sorbitol transporter subunit IIA [Actinomycetota bacterium]